MATGPFRASVTLALALVVAATALTAQAADVAKHAGRDRVVGRDDTLPAIGEPAPA